MKSKNQKKKAIGEKISSFFLTIISIGLVYFLLVLGIEKSKEEENQYSKEFVDSVIAKNEKIQFLEKDSAFIQWSNAGIRYAFRKWLKLNPDKKQWEKKYIDQKQK